MHRLSDLPNYVMCMQFQHDFFELSAEYVKAADWVTKNFKFVALMEPKPSHELLMVLTFSDMGKGKNRFSEILRRILKKLILEEVRLIYLELTDLLRCEMVLSMANLQITLFRMVERHFGRMYPAVEDAVRVNISVLLVDSVEEKFIKLGKKGSVSYKELKDITYGKLLKRNLLMCDKEYKG